MECAGALVCTADNGGRFGFSQLLDVCVAPTCSNGVFDLGESGVDCGGGCGSCTPVCTLPSGHASRCSAHCQCAAGLGDCDSDSDCLPGLKCVADRGAAFGFAPQTDVCSPVGGFPTSSDRPPPKRPSSDLSPSKTTLPPSSDG